MGLKITRQNNLEKLFENFVVDPNKEQKLKSTVRKEEKTESPKKEDKK
ncbi:SPJ_0845 family protein [Ligilactobacillus ceti]|nr:SPJ_0845 family protein [Ligilactobacillus ceti]